MRGTPCKYRRNRYGADMSAWLAATAGNNDEARARMLHALRRARVEALTQRQSEVLRMHFEEQMGVSDIARALGVNRSTVSRTIVRAKNRLYDRLRYTS